MSDPNDRIRRDVAFCKEVAEGIGLGFELPSKNAVVGPNGPTIVGSENSDPFHSGNSEPPGNSRNG
jgi:hypothetical protein